MSMMPLALVVAWLCCLHIASRRDGEPGRRARVAMGASLIAIALAYCAFLARVFMDSGVLLAPDKSADRTAIIATEGDPLLMLLAGAAALAFPALLLIVGWRTVAQARRDRTAAGESRRR